MDDENGDCMKKRDKIVVTVVVVAILIVVVASCFILSRPGEIFIKITNIGDEQISSHNPHLK